MASRPRATGKSAPAKTLSEILSAGNRRQSLEAMRDELARAMERADPNVVAQIAARLQAILKELAELPNAEKVTKADELAARRKARRAAAAVAAPPAAKSVKRRPRSS